jgi:ABC-type transporter Mla subunit MlaD
VRKRLLIPVALLLLLPAVLAGCGSSNSSPEADWAQNFCDALGTWKASVTQAGKTLADTSNLSKNTAQQAVDSISSANTKLVDDLKALGKPEGSSGPQAKEAVQTLSNQLQQDAKTVKNAMKGVSTTQELLSAIPTMANAASAAATAVSTTISQLESLDTSDKWKQAFEDSDACKSLKNV